MSNIKGQQIATLSAEGFVTGKVTMEKNAETGVFVHESGQSFPCKVAPGLKDSPNFGNTQLYKVYPYHKKETGLNFLVQEEVEDEPSDVFDFVAKVQAIGEGDFTVAVWSTTNQRYFMTKISGFIQAKRDQLWNLECELDGQELLLIDGRKLAEKWSLPADWKGAEQNKNRSPIRAN
ncbi:MAG: hypothetical protein H6677_17325 [Candidatus Obscuribacterales bacterium]|mgnify:CR=1 FL=1|nr:hypothetical protein [Candidatus Obscuribacterales bacterium]